MVFVAAAQFPRMSAAAVSAACRYYRLGSFWFTQSTSTSISGNAPVHRAGQSSIPAIPAVAFFSVAYANPDMPRLHGSECYAWRCFGLTRGVIYGDVVHLQTGISEEDSAVRMSEIMYVQVVRLGRFCSSGGKPHFYGMRIHLHS